MPISYKSLAGSITAISVFAAGTAAFAQSSSSASPIAGAQVGAGIDGRPVPTQECLLAMVTLEGEHLEHFDERIADEKARMQQRIDALSAVAALADDTARAEALRAMHEERKDAARPAPPEDVEAAMEAVKEACGDVMMFHKGPGMGGHGMFMMKMHGRGHRGPDMLIEKLGMTEEEFTAAVDSGKTIEEIAEEQGVELPAKAFRFERRFGDAMFDEDVSEPIEAQ